MKEFISFLENSKAEGARLIAEEKALQPFEFEGFKIHYSGMPTLTDGKVKMTWSKWKKKGMMNCLICKAGPKELAKKNGKFKPHEENFKFGIACLHVRICAFNWMCKTLRYKDIRRYRKKKGEANFIKNRTKQLKAKIRKEFGRDAFKVNPGLNQFLLYFEYL